MSASHRAAKIIVCPEHEQQYELELAAYLTIGRMTDNQLVIDEDNVSRYHAEIRHMGKDRYRFFDLGSANGAWINRQRITTPTKLSNGDQIQIGKTRIKFICQEEQAAGEAATTTDVTLVELKKELIVIMVSDIRNYTRMSEVLPAQEFSKFVASWFRKSGQLIQRLGGVIDKFIGDAIMAYWVVGNADEPGEEVDAAITAAQEKIELALEFSKQLAGRYPGHQFKIGIGMNSGEAVIGNVGAGARSSFTVMGDAVNIAFRLETLSKEKATPIVLSSAVAELSSKKFAFLDLGEVQIKGRQEPVSICGLPVSHQTPLY